jgi:mannose-6-phosphate isomerase-like protein (cupin superfamily)
MTALKDELDIRPPVHRTEGDRIVEIFRGDGEVLSVLGNIRQATLVTLQPGKSAGNHSHRRKKEIIHVINGRLRGVFRKAATGERLEAVIEQGFRLNILPGTEHVFINETNEPVMLIEFASAPFSPDSPDSQKADLI